LITPFPNTALSEILSCTVLYGGPSPLPVRAAYVVNSSKGPVFEGELTLTHNSTAFPLPTVGPCEGNGLRTIGQQIWSDLKFEKNTTDYTANCQISRQYQNASISLGVLYYLNFLQGLNSYYAIDVPAYVPLGLKVEIRRINNSLPAPKALFTAMVLATNQKCLNPGIPDETLPGVVEQYNPGTDPNAGEYISHLFLTVLPAKTTVFLDVSPSHSAIPVVKDLFQGYTINMTLLILPSPVPPPPKPVDGGTVFGVICGILVVIGGVGVAYYLCVKRQSKGDEYKPLTQ